MKKIVCAFVVLMLAAPASAAVNITAVMEVVPEPNILISYECTGGEVVRCFALDIQLDNDETIIAVECLSDDYYLNPQKFTYDGVTPDFGVIPCLCAADDGILPGLDSNGITIAMCTLYAENDPDHNVPPATSNGLVRLTLSGSACITITENGRLGGIFDEDNVDIDPNLHVPYCVSCCQCLGDIADLYSTGPPDGLVNTGDLNKLIIAMYGAYPTGDTTGIYDLQIAGLECMDIADLYSTGPPDGQINTGDLNKLIITFYGAYPTGDTTGIYEIGCQ
ncbi:MAG: hypothetical protein ACYSTG_11585 [Planctomycetota bacterium]|jgi:hypothetical protein